MSSPAAGERTRGAGVPALGQRAGVRLAGDAAVDCRTGHRNGADRAREAVAERRGGELQRQVPR